MAVLLVWVVVVPVAAQDTSGGGGFVDVDEGSTHWWSITELASAGVLDGTGCDAGRFCPDEGITRRTLAVWLVRVLDEGRPPAGGGQAEFVDVDSDGWEAPFVSRLAGLGVTSGCASDPPRFCPDSFVTRAQMASFLVRAFGMPQAGPGGFGDVDVSSVHAGSIDRLAAAGITHGCATGPLRFCPATATSRAQMATFLARALRWQQTEAAQVGEPPDAPGGVEVTVPDDDNADPTLRWRETGGDVDHYVVQWRQSYESFDDARQKALDPAGLTVAGRVPDRVFSLTLSGVRNACMLQVLAVNSSGRAASDEAFIPTPSCRIRRIIKETLVDVYRDEHPWLEETWAHMNQPDFEISTSTSTVNANVSVGYSDSPASPLSSATVSELKVPTRQVGKFYNDTYLHEMAHVYTLTNGIADTPGPLGVAHLYFIRFAREARDSGYANCIPEEIYAETGVALIFSFAGTYGGYWSGCPLDTPTDEPTEEAVKVVRQAFSGQMPDWLYETYQRTDGSLDLETLWEEVKAIEYYLARHTIIYQLRNEFGGYCSEYRPTMRNPWKDGGCGPQTPQE